MPLSRVPFALELRAQQGGDAFHYLFSEWAVPPHLWNFGVAHVNFGVGASFSALKQGLTVSDGSVSRIETGLMLTGRPAGTSWT